MVTEYISSPVFLHAGITDLHNLQVLLASAFLRSQAHRRQRTLAEAKEEVKSFTEAKKMRWAAFIAVGGWIEGRNLSLECLWCLCSDW